MKKILVLGASGMAGHTIAIYFKELGYDVTGFSRRGVKFVNSIRGDISELGTIENILGKGYDAVINCIGILNADAETNKSDAVFANSYLPHLLSRYTRDTPTKIIHMSTDCVFAGNTGPYNEIAFPDGKTFYDRSKALGELNDKKNLTFRNSIIGPDISPNGIGLFNWFMKQQGAIKGFTHAIWTGVTTITLAEAMQAAIEQDISGLYNLVNNESISKYNLLNLFNKYFKGNDLKIIPSDDLKLNKTLVNTRADFNFKIPSYEEMILNMRDWVIGHKDLYKHYTIHI